MIPKIKICGITNLADAHLAVKNGAWALGFVFYGKSPRFVLPEKVSEIVKSVPENILKTGVFVNQSFDEIEQIQTQSDINVIQLHGDESPEFCLEIYEKLNLPVIKAFRVGEDFDVKTIAAYKNKIFAALLDAYSPSKYGGTGKTFNYEIAVKAACLDIPIIVAGGITPENIKGILEKTNPFALDISSGVELSKGLKDKSKLEKLFKAVQ